jgi:outer membrane lipoprotein-sorting protein
MNRRTLLRLLPLTLAALPALSPRAHAQAAAAPLPAQDAADVQRVEAYLNGLTSLKARFLQVGPDGRTSQGTTWLERPGKMRFQYDPPTPLLLVAGGGLFVYYDSQLRQTTNIPLDRTPLSILLAKNVQLHGDVTVTDVSRDAGAIDLGVVRTASPGDGQLTMVFADNPLSLRGWVVTDAQHRETRVSLFNIELGGHFDSDMFYFVDPRSIGGG